MTLRTALLACVALACISGNPAFAKDRTDKLAKVTQDPFVSGEAALVAGQFGNARELLTQATAAAPTDGRRQLMLAMALHADALSSGKRDMVDMATVGYRNALKFRNGDFWANAMAGRLAYDEGKPAEALSFLSAAAIMQPDSADIFSSVAAAAYQTGDLPLARIASERALLLSKTQPSSSTLRTATLTAAAQGNQIDAETYLKQLSIFDPEAEAATRTRATQLLRTSGVEKDAANIPLQLPVEADDIGPNQITVDVAIILSQTESTNRTGINLLDGLRLQFGLNDDLTRSNQSGLGQIRDRVLTRAISIPELSYSLNLFNRANQSYRVVARPSLTAFRGETSEFLSVAKCLSRYPMSLCRKFKRLISAFKQKSRRWKLMATK
jgi:Tfp pilus assembly protein PilF